METGLQAVNQQRKLSEWAERVSACRNSGLSVKTWCRENGVSEQTYYKWQRRLYFLFANTPGGAQGSAVIFSLIQTGIENGLDPWRYLIWLIDSAAKDDVDVDGLFP